MFQEEDYSFSTGLVALLRCPPDMATFIEASKSFYSGKQSVLFKKVVIKNRFLYCAPKKKGKDEIYRNIDHGA